MTMHDEARCLALARLWEEELALMLGGNFLRLSGLA